MWKRTDLASAASKARWRGAVLPLTLRRAADAADTSANKGDPTCVPQGK